MIFSPRRKTILNLKATANFEKTILTVKAKLIFASE